MSDSTPAQDPAPVVRVTGPAPELAAAMAESRACRDRITAARQQLDDLAAELELSAAATEPSRKSGIERQAARRIRDIAAGLEG